MQFLTAIALSLSLLTPVLAVPQPQQSSASAAASSSVAPPAAPSPSAPAPPPSPPPPVSPSGLTLYQQLVLAPTAVDRLALLRDDEFKFNFMAQVPGRPGVASGRGGRTVTANHRTFPALVGAGAAVTIGFLGPCGFNTPHVHPRATELNLVVQGSLMSSFIAENGVRRVDHHQRLWEMVVFPQGALHEEFNPDCGDTVFVASFGHEDPGVGAVAEELFNLPPEVLRAALGVDSINGADVDRYKALIPPNVALGVETCLKKCNIPKNK